MGCENRSDLYSLQDESHKNEEEISNLSEWQQCLANIKGGNDVPQCPYDNKQSSQE